MKTTTPLLSAAALFLVSCGSAPPQQPTAAQAEKPSLCVCANIADSLRKRQTPDAPRTLIEACMAQNGWLFDSDDQPLTMAGGSFLSFAEGSWDERGFYSAKGAVREIEFFQTDDTGDRQDLDIKLHPANGLSFTATIYSNGAPWSILKYKTDSTTNPPTAGWVLERPNGNLRKFKRFLHLRPNAGTISIDRVDFSNVQETAGGRLCTIAGGVADCHKTQGSRNKKDLGFTLVFSPASVAP